MADGSLTGVNKERKGVIAVAAASQSELLPTDNGWVDGWSHTARTPPRTS